MAKVSGGAAVGRTLKALGFERIFGLEGAHIDPILFAARAAGIELLDVRHESVAGYAADGYYRTTGRLAACVVTAGPGYTNAISAITSAYLDSVPVLFIAGAAPLHEAQSNALQGGFDQLALARPITKWAQRATSIATIPALLSAAVRTMLDGRPGPAFLEVPMDLCYGQVDEAQVAIPETFTAPARPAPQPVQVKRAAMLLANAERPAIIAGSGALLSRCSTELAEFAAKAAIPVFSNLKALGVLPGSHPHACGSVADLVYSGLKPDLVFILGARHGMFLGGAGNSVIPAGATVIQVDLDGAEIGRLHPVDLGMVADCRESVAALVNEPVEWPARREWLAAAQDSGAWHRQRYADVLLEGDHLPLHPYRIASAVAELADERTVLVQDGGDTGGWAETCLSHLAAGPGKYFALGYLGNLGMHQGFAIAAQVAHPDHRVICLTGDGAAGFQMQEFDTMVRHGLPIVTVVFNNRVWGMSYEFQARMPSGLAWVELGSNLRYDLICAACGGHGELVSSASELKPALERALASGKPACVNVICRPAPSPKTETTLGNMGLDTTALPYYAGQKK